MAPVVGVVIEVEYSFSASYVAPIPTE